MWFCIHVFDACALIFFTFTIWGDFTDNPLVTTLHDTVYPIDKIPFPAVTVCSNNRVSRKEAIAFSKELWEIYFSFHFFYIFTSNIRASKEFATKDADDYLKDLEFIGRIYDNEIESEHLMTAFQQFLDQTINDTKTFNFSSIVRRVSCCKCHRHALIIKDSLSIV